MPSNVPFRCSLHYRRRRGMHVGIPLPTADSVLARNRRNDVIHGHHFHRDGRFHRPDDSGTVASRVAAPTGGSDVYRRISNFFLFFFSFSAGRVSCRESGSAHRWRCFPSAGREEVTSVDRGARRSATFLSASSVARPCQRLLPFSDWFAFPQKLTSPIPTMPRFESTPSVVAHRLRGSLAHLLFFSFEANQPSIQRNLLFMSAPYSSVVDASSTTTAGSFMAACGFGGVSFSGQCDWRTPGCLDKVGHDHVKMAVRGSRGDSVGSDPLASSRSYFYK